MAIIGFLLFGLFVGLVARLILPGRQKIGLRMTLLLGVIGSLIGGVIANALRTGDFFELNVIGSVAAIAASVVLLAVAERSGLTAGNRRGELRR
jgi:uncharacterized membrane protein YeaQ/YmgE (transglycosylase-associated protein family)